MSSVALLKVVCNCLCMCMLSIVLQSNNPEMFLGSSLRQALILRQATPIMAVFLGSPLLVEYSFNLAEHVSAQSTTVIFWWETTSSVDRHVLRRIDEGRMAIWKTGIELPKRQI